MKEIGFAVDEILIGQKEGYPIENYTSYKVFSKTILTIFSKTILTLYTPTISHLKHNQLGMQF